MGKISVVISAHNEEKNIKDCLESVKGFADEIIVIDNSSTDKTAKIASEYTKNVFEQKNDPSKIDLQKNFGFSKATEEWILSIDADERITPELEKEIKQALEDPDHINGYWIPRKNIIFGKWIKSDMWWPDYQLKIFRQGNGGFEKGVHRTLKVEGATDRLDNFMIHENYSTVSQYIIKLNNYTDVEASVLAEDGYKFNWLDSIRFPVDDFAKTFFLQKGYKDGLHGLVLSFLQAFYMEIVFAKLWEKHKFQEIEESNFLKEVEREIISSAAKIRYWFASSLINDSSNPVIKIILKTKRKLSFSKIKK